MCETFKHFVRKGKERGELERRLRLYTKPTTCGKISFEGDSNAEAHPVIDTKIVTTLHLLRNTLRHPCFYFCEIYKYESEFFKGTTYSK